MKPLHMLSQCSYLLFIFFFIIITDLSRPEAAVWNFLDAAIQWDQFRLSHLYSPSDRCTQELNVLPTAGGNQFRLDHVAVPYVATVQLSAKVQEAFGHLEQFNSEYFMADH